jgi:hypothetical protein
VAAVHQQLAVVEHQGRRLGEGVDGVELVEIAKHRQALVLEGDAEHPRGDDGAPDEG